MSATDSVHADILPDNDTTQVKISSKSNPKSLFSKYETSSIGKDGSYYEQRRKNHNESVTRKDEDTSNILLGTHTSAIYPYYRRVK